jgi:hypothetical protein
MSLDGSQPHQRSSLHTHKPLAGDGWSSRMEESVMNGCIPVIIMDNVDAALGGMALDEEAFSVRIPEAELKGIMEKLRAIAQADIDRMHRGLEKVWHR